MKIKENKNYIYVSLFFLVIVFALFLGFGFYPFGDKSILTSDMRSQYADFLSFFKNSLSSLYSFNIGMGGDVLALFAYYLCTPINLLVFLFDNMAAAGMVIFIIKIYLCAFTCSCFLKNSKIFRCENNIANAILSISYAFCGFNIMYSMSILWHDSVYLFPLLILAVEKSIFENKRYLILITAFAVLVNFYTGIMSVYFSLVYIAFLFFMHKEDVKEKFLFTVENYFLGASLSAVLLVPSLIVLSESKMADDNTVALLLENLGLSVSEFFDIFAYAWLVIMICIAIIKAGCYFIKSDKKIKLYKSISGVLAICFVAVFVALNVYYLVTSFSFDNFKELSHFLPFNYDGNAPQLYSGVLTIIGVIVLIINAVRKKSRNRFTVIALLLVALIPVVSKELDLLLHFGQEPISFPFRYTFAISLIFVAAVAYEINSGNIQWGKWFSVLISVVFVAEMCVSAIGSFKYNEKFWYGYTSYSSFDTFQSETKKSVDRLPADNSFYRVEKNFLRNINDCMQFNYKGMSHYSSVYNKGLMDFLERSGCITSMLYYTYVGQMPLLDSLFGVKYLLNSESEEFILKTCPDVGIIKSYYEDVYQLESEDQNISTYKNDNAVDFAFWTHEDILSLKATTLDDNAFENLNRVFDGFVEGEVKPYVKHTLSQSEENVFNVEIIEDGCLFISLMIDAPDCNAIIVNGEYMADASPDMFAKNRRNIYCGKFKKGDSVTVEVESSEPVASEKVNCYVESSEAYNLINEGFKNKDISYQYISDKEFTVKTKKGGLLVTEIPYDDNWKVYCDNKEIKPENILDVFLGINVPDGEHQIEIRYECAGLKPSAIISLLTVWICVLDYILKKYKKFNFSS